MLWKMIDVLYVLDLLGPEVQKSSALRDVFDVVNIASQCF